MKARESASNFPPARLRWTRADFCYLRVSGCDKRDDAERVYFEKFVSVFAFVCDISLDIYILTSLMKIREIN